MADVYKDAKNDLSDVKSDAESDEIANEKSKLRGFGLGLFGGISKHKERDEKLAIELFIQNDSDDAGVVNNASELSTVEGVHNVLSKYAEIMHEIMLTCEVLSEARSRNQVIDVIGAELKNKSTRSDVRAIIKSVDEKLDSLDLSYRKKLLAKVEEMYLGTYHEIFILYESRDFRDYISKPGKACNGYWTMVHEACKNKATTGDPSLLFLKYLIIGFRIFGQNLPAHPVGTPFPGGHEVEMDFDGYFCPVRDKADDVLFAVCPYCPARQSTEFMLRYNRKQRSKKLKEGSIQNYFVNFKG